MKTIARPKDLTIGNPLTVLLAYSLPMFASMFFQQAYNLVDSWIAGNWVGAISLGAVGTCYPITVFCIAIASGLSMGTSIYCSQHFGASASGKVRMGITTSLMVFLPFSVLLMIVGLFSCSGILSLFSVPAEAWLPTEQYLRIYLAGLPFLFLYNITTGILNGLGDSKTPLIFLIGSSLMNIILDLVLVILLPLGIRGLALATLLSQAAAAIATFVTVLRLIRQLEAETDVPRFSLPVLREILNLGIPSVIQHAFMSTGQMVLQNVINRYGIIVMAGYSVAFRINGLYVNSNMALSNALSGFIAQNKGAGNIGRIRQSYRLSVVITGIFSLLTVLLLLTCGRPILSFFVGDDPEKAEIVAAGMGFFRIVVPFYLMVFLKNVSDGALRGIGNMKAFMFATILDVMFRIFLGPIFSDRFGLNGVWWVWPAAWLVGTSISFGAWLWGIHKLSKHA